MAVGYAKDADDIGDVRKFVEYISYPGNPSLTREADENVAGNSDKSEPGTSGQSLGERQIPLILIQKKKLLSVHQTAVMIQISVLLHR